MNLKLQIIAGILGIFIFVYIIELVRKRRLREEYSWLWLITGAAIVVLSLWYDLLLAISTLLGGIYPSSVLFLFGLLFLLVICVQQSIKISSLTDQVKELSQEIAIMNVKMEDGQRTR
jgi:hypothetical protein